MPLILGGSFALGKNKMSQAILALEKHKGSLTRKESSTHCCRFWFVPLPDRLDMARSVFAFFDSQEEAQQFSKAVDNFSEVYDLGSPVWDNHFSLIKYEENGVFAHQNHL